MKLETEWKGASKKATDPIVGLEFANDKLYSCSAHGRVIVRDLQSEDSEFSFWSANLKEPISAFRIHPNQPEIVSSGGKDRDLEVMQLFNPQTSDSRLGVVRANWLLHVLQSDDMGQQRLRKKWHSKRPRADESGFRCPTWTSDIQFLDTGRSPRLGWRLIESTRYGHVNIYETKLSQSPVVSVLTSFHPLVNLWFGGNEYEVIYTDTQNGVGVFDSVSGQAVKMKGEAGSSMLHIHASYKDGKSEFPEIQGERVGMRTAVLSHLEEEEDRDEEESSETASILAAMAQDIPENTSLPPSPRLPSPSEVASSQSAGPLLVSGGMDTYLRVYDLQAARMVTKLNTKTKISEVCILDTTNEAVDDSILGRRRTRRALSEEAEEGQPPNDNNYDKDHDSKRQRLANDSNTTTTTNSTASNISSTPSSTCNDISMA